MIEMAASHRNIALKTVNNPLTNWVGVYEISFHSSKYPDFLFFMEDVRNFYGKNVTFAGIMRPVDFKDNDWVSMRAVVRETVLSQHHVEDLP